MFEDEEAPRRSTNLNFAVVSAIGLTLLCVVIGAVKGQTVVISPCER